MRYEVNLENIKEKNIYLLDNNFKSTNKNGTEISFTNYFMQKNGEPFYGISGEFHFSRMEDLRWEDEIIKMKLGGINVISTYIFWNHHEEEEGVFDFKGRRNLRKFVQLCDKIDNEYMHSSAPWEITTGISQEWVFGGDKGDEYMLYMKELAAQCGLIPVFYTCTGWGGASTPETFMPLWGGYSFRPWMFYSLKGEHPCTEEYIYQDFHNNDIECTNDFKPMYKPEELPYACCEMGGGMTCSYNYRFKLPFKSVDAMANIKIASGCNFLGYYMYQGGSNPLGKHGTFMNEGQVPKISYDYQAPLGEFGQVRESYRRLKRIHYFIKAYENKLCKLKTVLPEGASYIDPSDMKTLRYAVRTDGEKGFIFINNYQDHAQMTDKRAEEIVLKLQNEELVFSNISIDSDENCILPFHLDMEGIDLIKATAQPITILERNGIKEFIFFTPNGMESTFYFESGVSINGENTNIYTCDKSNDINLFTVQKGDKKIKVICMTGEISNYMYICKNNNLVFTKAALLEDENGIRVETEATNNMIYTYPADLLKNSDNVSYVSEHNFNNLLGGYKLNILEKVIDISIIKVGPSRYTIDLPKDYMNGLKDLILQVDYVGDIGHAFIDGKMISDNFYNNDTWEIGLKEHAIDLEKHKITIYITPLKEGVNVNVESAMAARMEEVDAYIGNLNSVKVKPIYEIYI